MLILGGGIALSLSIALVLFAPAIGKTAEGWRGIFGHKQNCAAAATLFLVTGMHWRPSGIFQQMFRVIYVAMCAILIVMSQSRTGWGLAVMAVCLWVTLRLLQRIPAKDALLVVFAAVPVVLALRILSLVLLHSFNLASVRPNTKSAHHHLGGGMERSRSASVAWLRIKALWAGLKGPSLDVVLTSGWVLAQAQSGYLDTWVQLGVSGVCWLRSPLAKRSGM